MWQTPSGSNSPLKEYKRNLVALSHTYLRMGYEIKGVDVADNVLHTCLLVSYCGLPLAAMSQVTAVSGSVSVIMAPINGVL